MNREPFTMNADNSDREVQFNNQLLYELRTRYDKLARYIMRHNGWQTVDLNVDFAHGSGGRYKLYHAQKIMQDNETGDILIVCDDQSTVPFAHLMTDVQDYFVSLLHIEHSTQRIMKQTSRNNTGE